MISAVAATCTVGGWGTRRFYRARIQVIRSKDDALLVARREARAKDLEIAALRGDIAGEQRLRAAAEAKLKDVYSERDEVRSRDKLRARGVSIRAMNDKIPFRISFLSWHTSLMEISARCYARESPS